MESRGEMEILEEIVLGEASAIDAHHDKRVG
jgi:hypothetical protein